MNIWVKRLFSSFIYINYLQRRLKNALEYCRFRCKQSNQSLKVKENTAKRREKTVIGMTRELNVILLLFRILKICLGVSSNPI